MSNWDRFLMSSNVSGLGKHRKALYDRDVALAEEQYQNENARFFARRLASRHQWRLYQWLRPKAVYLDIETDSFGQVTVVGLYGNGAMTSLVRGDTLTDQRLRTELAQYDVVVTFCGTGFDVPMLRAQFSRLPLDQPHIDLHNLTGRVGLRGGLKVIEARIGIQRRADLLGMDGSDAVRSWNRWRHGRDPEALERLIAYNEADCVNLEPLADWLYCRLAQRYQDSFSLL
jgi:uncharacterized protein YprB with RNaseH-like and TPR domain